MTIADRPRIGRKKPSDILQLCRPLFTPPTSIEGGAAISFQVFSVFSLVTCAPGTRMELVLPRRGLTKLKDIITGGTVWASSACWAPRTWYQRGHVGAPSSASTSMSGPFKFRWWARFESLLVFLIPCLWVVVFKRTLRRCVQFRWYHLRNDLFAYLHCNLRLTFNILLLSRGRSWMVGTLFNNRQWRCYFIVIWFKLVNWGQAE